MNLNEYDNKIKTICEDCSREIKKTNRINTIYVLRNELHCTITKVNELIEQFEEDEFRENIEKYKKWIARTEINGHSNVVVEIDSIIWDREIINWHNITEEYPKGGSIFRSFKEEFFPWRE